jgi:hypothetical protein
MDDIEEDTLRDGIGKNCLLILVNWKTANLVEKPRWPDPAKEHVGDGGT